MTAADRARAFLADERAIINEADVAWIVDLLAGDLAAGYDGDAVVYREHVHDVVGALIGRGIDPTRLRLALQRAAHEQLNGLTPAPFARLCSEGTVFRALKEKGPSQTMAEAQ